MPRRHSNSYVATHPSLERLRQGITPAPCQEQAGLWDSPWDWFDCKTLPQRIRLKNDQRRFPVSTSNLQTCTCMEKKKQNRKCINNLELCSTPSTHPQSVGHNNNTIQFSASSCSRLIFHYRKSTFTRGMLTVPLGIYLQTDF